MYFPKEMINNRFIDWPTDANLTHNVPKIYICTEKG